MDITEVPDKNRPNHPISIHDMDIDKAIPLAATWWRSERSEWLLTRALLVWLIYEADPPTMYSADNPADVNTFDRFYEGVFSFSKKLMGTRCPHHGVVNSGVVRSEGVTVMFHCFVHPPHSFHATIEAIQQRID